MLENGEWLCEGTDAMTLEDNSLKYQHVWQGDTEISSWKWDEIGASSYESKARGRKEMYLWHLGTS